jgi:mannose-6-phosphate isomerase-like protein (cupin superfamily)
MSRTVLILLATTAVALAVDPTYLRRTIASVTPQPDDLTRSASGALYRPAFGAGDPDARQLKSVARYGELTVLPGGGTNTVSRSAEEQVWYVLDGAATLAYGQERVPIRAGDFLYLPVSLPHAVSNSGQQPVRILIMGFRIPKGSDVKPTPKLMLANSDDVPLITLPSHGPTTQFKLLMGTTESTRDKLAAASQMVSLFIMDFAPGGTNIPHHHESEEEIYYILRGSGEMVAGEGRYPTKAGEAFFIRLNSNVGFFSGAQPGQPHDLVLAVRSTFPRR